MTKKEAYEIFRNNYRRYHQDDPNGYEADGIPDYPGRVEQWGFHVDALLRDGLITEKQADNWSAPRFCHNPRSKY